MAFIKGLPFDKSRLDEKVRLDFFRGQIGQGAMIIKAGKDAMTQGDVKNANHLKEMGGRSLITGLHHYLAIFPNLYDKARDLELPEEVAKLTAEELKINQLIEDITSNPGAL
jgi:hypothetical protein